MATNQTNKASAWGTIVPVLIAAVVLGFFLLIGVPQDKAAPYIGLVVAVTAIAFCAALWTARVLQGVGRSYEGAFRIIGISLVLGVTFVDLLVLLAYRIYLNSIPSEGWIFGFLLLANAFVFLLILGLPWYARFAGGLSRADREQKADVIFLTDRLEQAEQKFIAILRKAGKNITANDRPAITILREKTRAMSPFSPAGAASVDVDSQFLADVDQIERAVRDGLSLPPEELDAWATHVGGLCSEAIGILQRREKLILA